MKFDFKGSAMLALPVTAAVWLVSYLFGLVGIGTTPLFSSVTSTITPTVGTKVFGLISGILPFQLNLMNIFYVYLSAIVAIMLGTWLMNQFKLMNLFPKNFLGFNSNASRLASVLVWGAVPVYLLLVGFAIPSLMTFVGILIHAYTVGIVTGWIANFFKLKV